MGRHKQEPTKTLNIRIRESLYATLASEAGNEGVGAYIVRRATEHFSTLQDILLLKPTETTIAQEKILQAWLETCGVRYVYQFDEAKQRINHWLRKTDDRDGYNIHPWYITALSYRRCDIAGHLPFLGQLIGAHLPVSDLTFPVLNA